MMEKRMLKKVSTVTSCRNDDDSNARNAGVSGRKFKCQKRQLRKNPTITKQITKESNIYAPKTTFKIYRCSRNGSAGR